MELFVARTKALNAGFTPTAEDLASIAAICRHLDGIPLAIEFAAARAAVLSVQLVAAGLRDRFALLTAGRRTALPRQRTLRATLDWSHDLLPETERQLLRRLAVFPGGFTVDAAVAVMADTGFDASAVLAGIANLVAKSWVALDKSGAGARWNLLETIRAYALEKLVESGESDDAQRRHAAFFRDLFAPPASGSCSGSSTDDLARHVGEIDNVRAALDWSFSSAGDQAIGVDLTVAYAPIWTHLLLMNESRARCERALLSLEPHVTANTWLRIQLQINLAGALITTMGSASQAITILTQALEASETLDDLDAQVRSLSTLSVIYTFSGEYGRAQIAAERIEQIAHRLGNPIYLRFAYQQMGATLLPIGRPREAQQYLERVLRFPAAPGDRRSLSYSNWNDRALARAMLARALWIQGFADQALNEARLGVEDLHDTDHPLFLCRILFHGICRVATMIGDFATADRRLRV